MFVYVCFMFVKWLVLQIDLTEGSYICEKSLEMCICLWPAFDCLRWLCGWQDIKIQLLLLLLSRYQRQIISLLLWILTPTGTVEIDCRTVASYVVVINAFTASACKKSGMKSALMHACKQYIWWPYNISTFNTAQFHRNLFTCSCAGGKRLNDFKFGTFVDRFQSDCRGKRGSERVKVLYTGFTKQLPVNRLIFLFWETHD